MSDDPKADAAMAAERRRVDLQRQQLYAFHEQRDTPRPESLGPREKRKPMPSDFHNVKSQGCACIGCGTTPDKERLLKIRKGSTVWSCLRCFLKYSNCGNCNHEQHAKRSGAGDPTTPCMECGCRQYIHGLEAEFDRQLADCVGKVPIMRHCLRGCGREVMMVPDPISKSGARIPLFCSACEREWAEFNQSTTEEHDDGRINLQ
jgi:hypothetical protein